MLLLLFCVALFFGSEISADVVSFLQYMEKRVFCQLNGNRKVIGIVRGYDVCPCPLTSSCMILGHPWPAGKDETKTVPIKRGITNDVFAQVFMNVVLDEAFEEKNGGEKVAIGMIVHSIPVDRYLESR